MSETQINLGLFGMPELHRNWLLTELSKYVSIRIAFSELAINYLQENIKIHKPDVVLIALKNDHLLKVISRIKNTAPELNIIGWWLGDQIPESSTLELLRAGASTILTDQHSPEEIGRAIESVYERGVYSNDIVTEAVFHYCKKHRVLPVQFGPEENFMPREIRAIELRRGGKTSREIGDTLCLSKKTIDKVFYELYRKFNCRNFFELWSIYESRQQV